MDQEQLESRRVNGLIRTCQWALTRKPLWGGGAHEVGDPRLLEDGGECNGAPGSDVVASETASEGHEGKR